MCKALDSGFGQSSMAGFVYYVDRLAANVVKVLRNTDDLLEMLVILSSIRFDFDSI